MGCTLSRDSSLVQDYLELSPKANKTDLAVYLGKVVLAPPLRLSQTNSSRTITPRRKDSENTLKVMRDRRLRELIGKPQLLQQPLINVEQNEDENATVKKSLSTLEKLKIIGRGMFGTVYLTRNQLGESYALKQMNKAHIVETGRTTSITIERNFLLEADHPFIVKLLNTYQDRDSVYLQLELVQGGELGQFVGQPISMFGAKFYVGCILDALSYVHSLGYLYRDMKTENILIDSRGYPKLVDFGLSRKISQDGVAFTMCGTTEYMAPEVISNSGYGFAADFWSAGVLLYELLVGQTPFVGENGPNDQLATIRNITDNSPDWSLMELEAATFAKKLLQKSPNDRLVRDWQSDEFFKPEISNWSLLHERKVKAPFTPQIENLFDASNFQELEPDLIWKVYRGDNTWCKDF